MKDEKNFMHMHPKEIEAQIEHCENKLKSYEKLKTSWQDILNKFNLTSYAEQKI